MWEFAHRNSAVVLTHTWESDPTCGPLMLEPIARDYPGARILLGHSGVTRKGYAEAIEAARRCENCTSTLPAPRATKGIVEHCVEQVGVERVVFGSDLPFLEAAMGIGRIAFARLPDSQRKPSWDSISRD